jgi:hypothetical protein
MAIPSGYRSVWYRLRVLAAGSSAPVLMPGRSSTRIRKDAFLTIAALSLRPNLRQVEAAGIIL